MRTGRRRRIEWMGLLALLALSVPALAREAAACCPPRYDLDVHLDLDRHTALVHQVVTWTNPCSRPAAELVFNAHSTYQIPKDQVGFMAKMLEILRIDPREGLATDRPACEIQKVTLLGIGSSPAGAASPTDLPFHFQTDIATALVVPLPAPVGPGESITVAIDFTMHLAQKQGRWGQWKGVTFLINWNPVVAVYDDKGWQPTPFVPWHQPFFNEAGEFNVRVTLPWDQKIACTGSVVAVHDAGNGLQQVDIHVSLARDFALLCSTRFREYCDQVGPVRVKCLAFPEHEHYARAMVRHACDAIETYTRWFGPYPYPEFTVVESYFGWNGNECAGLVMIDERIFGLPHVAGGFVEYLVSHEVCHQWWYNVIGTNGYCETWMDEAFATHFSHRLMDIKHGKHSPMLQLPKGLEWLPNIDRETYRYYGLYGTIGRGEARATVGPITDFGHVVNLFSMCYDRGSKIVGMIEDRMGETAFLDFTRQIYARYYFRILRVADFQRELAAYTGRPDEWDEFFRHWLYSADMTDWCVENVTIDNLALPEGEPKRHAFVPWKHADAPCKVTVLLHQKAEYNERTTLGICLDGGEGYQVRIPIIPQADGLVLDDPPARVCPLKDNRVRVEVWLPCHPTQIAVDPDQILVDRDPANNFWKPPIRFRVALPYWLLEETDLTTAYDRWNVTVGPWIYASAYDDPWFGRSPMAGVRAGLYRTQHFMGGAYAAYRTDFRDVVVGADALWDHWPWPHTQTGIVAERSLTAFDNDRISNRAVLYGRYIFDYGDSLYLPPIHYLEAFGAVVDNALPLPRQPVPGADHFDQTTALGLHYHLDYLTPYWYPEGGFKIEATVATGIPILGEHESFGRGDVQGSYVNSLPEWLGPLSETLYAVRLFVAGGLPDKGQFYALGGSEQFRGFDLRQRQGSLVWVGSVEWRIPLARDVTWDYLDHCCGVRNLYTAAFYDVGDAYLRGHALGDVAHAIGGGLRVEVAWFSFVERTTFRVDVAKTVNGAGPVQVWFGAQVPF